MRYALVNPQWSFEGSTYFGSQQPVMPIELFSAREMLRKAGHEVLLVDAFLERLTPEAVRARLDAFGEDFLVLPTANSYLFWRCPQPELRVPQRWLGALGRGATTVLIGPHGSATPHATLAKTGADIVLRGEPDQTLAMLADRPRIAVPGCVWRENGRFNGGARAAGCNRYAGRRAGGLLGLSFGAAHAQAPRVYRGGRAWRRGGVCAGAARTRAHFVTRRCSAISTGSGS